MPHFKRGSSQIKKKSIIEFIAPQTVKNKAFRKKMNPSSQTASSWRGDMDRSKDKKLAKPWLFQILRRKALRNCVPRPLPMSKIATSAREQITWV